MHVRIQCYLLNDLCQGWHWGLRVHRTKNRQNSYSTPVRGDNNANACIEWSCIEGGALTEVGAALGILAGLSSWGDDRGIDTEGTEGAHHAWVWERGPPLQGSVSYLRNSNSKTARGLSNVQKGEGRRGGQPSEKPQEEFGFY